jgi:predicted DNA-binding transcriptional regulator AlpA
MKEEVYTASEAITKLGLSRAMFHRKVKQGAIPKIVKPGMTHGVYPKRDIDALALSMEAAFDQHNKFVFSKSTPADQVEEMEIAEKYFGRDSIWSLSERIALQQKSEFTFYSLKVDNRVVGYAAMHNLSPEILDDILTGKRAIEELKAKDVLVFERVKPFDIYHSVIAIDPSLPNHLKHFYAGIMIRHRADMILRLIATNYMIENIYTVTVTREGDRLVQGLGFQKMEGKSLVKGRIAYRYHVDEKAIEHLEELSGRKIM